MKIRHSVQLLELENINISCQVTSAETGSPPLLDVHTGRRSMSHYVGSGSTGFTISICPVINMPFLLPSSIEELLSNFIEVINLVQPLVVLHPLLILQPSQIFVRSTRFFTHYDIDKIKCFNLIQKILEKSCFL